MRPKTYHVALAPDQRDELLRKSTSSRQSIRERKRARILLLCDEAQEGGAVADVSIAAQVKVCLATVARLLDGQAEAHLIALTCSTPPEGHKRWGLHLLKDTLIEQRIVDTISHEAVRHTIKKINSSRG